MLEKETPAQGHVCPWWLIPTFDNPLRRLVQNPDRLLSGLVSPGQAAADLGCGMGYFSVPLARLVGPAGRVFAVDLQSEMLSGVRKRAQRAGLEARIQLHQATPHSLGLATPVDFVLAFWMLHEVPDQERFLAEVRSFLKPGGRFLFVEPRGHVPGADFDRSVSRAHTAGFQHAEPYSVALSRAVLFS